MRLCQMRVCHLVWTFSGVTGTWKAVDIRGNFWSFMKLLAKMGSSSADSCLTMDLCFGWLAHSRCKLLNCLSGRILYKRKPCRVAVPNGIYIYTCIICSWQFFFCFGLSIQLQSFRCLGVIDCFVASWFLACGVFCAHCGKSYGAGLDFIPGPAGWRVSIALSIYNIRHWCRVLWLMSTWV